MSQDVWPIKESAGNRPPDWPGWPGGKKFALVLTHDVESAPGLAKCRQLMHLEMQQGFRSAFNFIPEADYDVPDSLLGDLRRDGFEVGVQDLKHDGKLFRSRETFRDGAVQINRYLRAWNARGFRSGFMFHNLNWTHDLEIDYSSCTFDTDPFEPQPDDVNTIFPFWVQRPGIKNGRSGYVELPYTLPQDSTLFLVLQEPQPDIWMKKLDWIAEHGGMALLNTHPDYMAADGRNCLLGEYPIEFYNQFLSYVKENYAGLYWQALPGEVADHISCNKGGSAHAEELVVTERRENVSHRDAVSLYVNGSSAAMPMAPQPVHSAPARTVSDPADLSAGKPGSKEFFENPGNGGHLFDGRRAAVLLFSEYPADPRPRRAAETLAREGMSVDVFCLRGNSNEPKCETIGGVNIFRLSLKRRRGGKAGYLFQYGAFISAAFVFLCGRSFGRRYHLVHVHNMPDVLVFSALVPRLLGAKIILDLHDPMPELMVTIFGLSENSIAVKLLKLTERCSIQFAHLVLTPNLAFERLFVSRGCPPGKIRIVMNSPSEEIFQFRSANLKKESCSRRQQSGLPLPKDQKEPSKKPFIILYHGSLVARHGLDIAVAALREGRESIPNAILAICGGNNSYFESVMKMVREHGLEQAVHYLGAKTQSQIADVIGQCDLGVIPNRRSIFTEINLPTRIFEYLVLGKPVVAPRTRGVLDYFGEDDIIFFEPDSATDLARKIAFVATHPDEIQQIVERGQAIYRRHRWVQQKERFIQYAGRILDDPLRAASVL